MLEGGYSRDAPLSTVQLVVLSLGSLASLLLALIGCGFLQKLFKRFVINIHNYLTSINFFCRLSVKNLIFFHY